MAYRYLIRHFRRLCLISSSTYSLLSSRKSRPLWISIGSSVLIGNLIHRYYSVDGLPNRLIAHAKVIKTELSQDEQQLFKAAHDGDIQILVELVDGKKLDVNQRHPLGWTPLLVAVINQKYDTVDYLLSRGADPNLSDQFTSVHSMSKELRIPATEVHYIRERDFSNRLSSRASFSGFTALHYAVLNNDLRTAKLLVKHGADPLVENEEGHLPSAYAKEYQKSALIELEANGREMHEERLKIERRRRPFEVRIKEHIVGQNYAIATVGAALRRKESGWTLDESPLVLLFLGSSGVGKTELAKQMARYLNGDKNHSRCFIRIDMSEYQEKHEVSKLIGAPPGYTGYQEGGQLTSALEKCPTAVVLFDEVDKAHPDVLTVLLQLFDEGRLTDGKGKTIDGRRAIYVMTSNLASEEIANYAQELRREEERKSLLTTSNVNTSEQDSSKLQVAVSKQFKDHVVKPILKRHFRRDEFLGRINEMVYFLPFSKGEINKLISKHLGFWKTRAKTQHGIDLTWDHKAVDCLAEGYDINYGARSLIHEIERSVLSQVAAAHDQGLIERGNQVLITAQENPFHTPFDQNSSKKPNYLHIKLQKVEQAYKKGIISGIFKSNESNQTEKIIYTDIIPEDHLKTYQF